MASLPKKVFFFFIFIISSILLIKPVSYIYAAANPQDIFTPLLQKQVQEEKDIYKNAKETDQVHVSSLPVTQRHLYDTGYGTLKMVGWCPDPEICDYKQTALGNVTQLMSALYAHPPASGLAYTQDLLANAGLVKPVYAQGIGFSALTPFLPFWKVTRNVAYAALILIMIAIGFMIIFRMKIDPKTIISIQAALPKIVLTLILITFSYPIVGFIIDLMYLTMAIVISLMVSGMGGTLAGADTANLQSTYMTAGAGDLFGAVFWPVQAFVLNFLKAIPGLVGAGAISGLIYYIGTLIPGAIFGAFAWWAVGLAVALPTLILGLIIFLGLLFTFIRLLLLLLNSYIQVVISLILGPIYLLGETIPGRAVFTGWLMNIIANLVVFPATAVIIMFSVWLTVQGQTDAPKWSPPFIGFYVPGGNFHALLGLGVMFIAPTLVAQIKKAFGPRPIMPITPATIIAPLTGSFQTAMGAGSQFYYAHSSIEALTKMFGRKRE